MGRSSITSGRLRQLAAVLLVISAGLCLRGLGPDLGLPFFVVKYGGSVLWGAMVFLLLAVLSGSGRLWLLAGGALAIAVGVEVFRLYHTPALDAFRMTMAGKLLLGRVFSPWNILAYAGGIGLATFVKKQFFPT